MKQTSNLSKAHVTRDSSGPAILAISVGPSPTISAQFSLKMCAAVEIAKNSLKTPYFRSFKVIDVDTNKKLVTSACSDKQYVCIHLQLFSL